LILAVLTGLFSFLPVFGTWMVYVPAAVYMYYSGNIFSAAGVLAFGIVILTIFIPMVLQPYFGYRQSDVNHTIIHEYMAFRIENEKNAMEYADY
jgi:predicted PurR-regulated permease PerM